LDTPLDRPSRSVFEAADAALAEVVFLVRLWESALPAADFDVLSVEVLRSVLEALDAAFDAVPLPCATAASSGRVGRIRLRDRTADPTADR
jgi:hypothetical protein